VNDEVEGRLTEMLGQVLSVTSNEAILLDNMEEFFEPKPASLIKNDADVRNLEDQLNQLASSLGGLPSIILVQDDKPRPIYDTYPNAAIDEMLTSFHSCRRSVCKVQMLHIAFPFVKRFPQWAKPPQSKEDSQKLSRALERRFWEEIEIAFIRIASFWDRAGQLLAFSFFNIRQYERDGFSSVMDRVHKNFLPMDGALEGCREWAALWEFKNSEKPDGLKWLISRRNILIHSLHLRPSPEEEVEDPIFASAYNHLEVAVHKKLKQDKPETELEYLHAHLKHAAEHLRRVVTVCTLARKIS